MRPSRRVLLQAAAAGAASALVRPASAQVPGLGTWYPPSSGGVYTPRKVLEIFLRGAASLYSSFWYDTILGDGVTGTGDTTLTAPEWQAITNGTVPVTNAFDGATIGEAADPLFRVVNTRKLADHMRVARVRHELATHEAGIAYAATGSTLGRVEMSGLGAAIWRRDYEATSTAGLRSIVLQAGTGVNDDLAALHASSTGRHGEQYRPPVLRLGDADFYDALLRTMPAFSDDLKKFYRNRYADRFLYTNPNTSEVFDVRSAGWAAYKASLDTMQTYSADLHALLAPHESVLFQPLAAPLDTHSSNYTRFAIDSAISLLVDPTNSLEHVAVIDGGVFSDYDTHTQADDRLLQNGNIWNVCDALALRTEDILDGQLVVLIHSEFGRKEKSGGTDGTEHHTRGYTNVVISDLVPLGSEGFAGTIVGLDLDEASHAEGTAVVPGLTPTDVHAAVAELAGIEPWQADMFDRNLACLQIADPADEILEVV